MIPVYTNQGQELPADELYYLIGSNGVFIHKVGLVESLIPVKNIPFLGEISPIVNLNFPKIPKNLVLKIAKFFKEVVDRYRTEANVLLYAHPTTKEIKIVVPFQEVGREYVVYSRKLTSNEETELCDFLCVGTIHSHCNFAAFHSHVDSDDEQHFDGLHVTFGDNDKETITIAASAVSGGYRRILAPTDVLEGIESFGAGYKLDGVCDENIEEWLAKIY